MSLKDRPRAPVSDMFKSQFTSLDQTAEREIDELTVRIGHLFQSRQEIPSQPEDRRAALKRFLRFEHGLKGIEDTSNDHCKLQDCIMRIKGNVVKQHPDACDHQFLLCWGCVLKYMETFDEYHECFKCGTIIKGKF